MLNQYLTDITDTYIIPYLTDSLLMLNWYKPSQKS